MFVLWFTFFVGGVNGDCAPDDIILQESSYVEVDLHYQLGVAKRVDS